ncbi:adenylosuccinate lyase [Nonlabens xiamenensis]|uniref:adenylosuccinate lyase n=1 Tax=Nonlabens xiamenensis TaxID=2341043 RepID=UPI000F611A30|nr:adenylosuccinate lyase [Nonlabens xiamenensis]
MDKAQLHKKLKVLLAYKKDRVAIGTAVVKYNLLTALIELCHPETGVSHQACWALEQVFLNHEEACHAHIADMAELYVLPINSSGMRSLSKIAAIIAKKFYGLRANVWQDILSLAMREKMLEGCFQILLDDQGKTANLAFATRAVYEFGKEFEWVYPELVPTVEHLLQDNPRGYTACGAKTLLLIANNGS